MSASASFRIATLPDFAPMRVQPSDKKWWLDQHDKYKWTYARTMPQSPHSYIWRDKEMTKPDYDRMFGALRTFGEPGLFWSRPQLYLHNRERKIRYWLMDRHYYTCTILNMATDDKDYGPQNIPSTWSYDFTEYDEIAPWWDDVYRTMDRSDSATLWKLVHRNVDVVQPTLLDIGAGTGGTLDSFIAGSRQTTAVDPSQGMLNDLVLKYPQTHRVVPDTFMGYLGSQGVAKHDLVVASFGSASYLTAREIRSAHELANQLTVFSFYAQTPQHRLELPATHDEALDAASSLLGARVMQHGFFTHVVIRP